MIVRVASRPDFERALTILSEGKLAHGLNATDDAKAVLRPIARCYWRQSATLVLSTMCSGGVAHAVTGNSGVWATLAGGTIGIALLAVALTAPVFRPLFAPAGFTASDVSRAFYALWGAGNS